MRGFRVHSSGLAGIATVLGAFAWLLRVLSSIAAEPPRGGFDGGFGPGGPAAAAAPVGAQVIAAEGEAAFQNTWLPRRLRFLRRWHRCASKRLAVLGIVVVALGLVGGLIAYFLAGSTAGSFGAAKAGTLPTGNTPALSLSTRDVGVTWTQSSPAFLGGLLGADANGGYLIKRYSESGGDAITPGPGCDMLQQGSTASLNCTETGLPTGRWKYTATPKYHNWLGPESGLSSHAIVAPAAPTSVTFVNGGGAGNAFIDSANASNLSFDVVLPSTSLSSDTVTLTLTDTGSAHTVTATTSGTLGAGTVHFTGVDGSSLDDGTITVSATATSSYSDSSPSSPPITPTKDMINPVVSVTAGRIADSNDWYNHAVTFSASGGDTGGSGIQSCDSDSTYSGSDGTGLTVTLHCIDNAGNTGTGSSGAFKYDATNPTVDSVTPDRAADSNSWYNHAVTWTANGTDTTSGIASCQSIAYSGPDGTGLTVNRTCVDKAGNSESAASPTFEYDATAPAVTVTATTGPDGTNSWYRSPVVFHVSGSDATSGGVTCDSNTTYSGPDDSSTTVSMHCTDAAGNQGAGTSAAFEYDATNPIVTSLTPDRSADSNGWYNHAVVWTAAGTDATSGIASCQSIAYSEPATASTTVTRTCTDSAGNTESGASAAFKYDATNPIVTSVTPDRSADSNGWYNHAVTWTARGTDATSGIDTCQPIAYSGDSANAQVSRSCTDNAGNTGSGLSPPFKYDGTNPTGSITNPTAGNVTGTVAAKSTDAADARSGVASVAYSYCAGPSCTPSIPIGSSSTAAGGYQVNWETTQLANGSYGLAAVITDVAGNTHTTSTVAVTIDNSYSFLVANPGTPTAGTAFGGFTVQLQVNGSNTKKYNGIAYTGAKTITFSGPGNSPAPSNTAPSYAASVSFTNGLATLPESSITLFNAESTHLTATDTAGAPTITGTSPAFTVSPAGLDSFALTNPGTHTAGAAFSVSITAKDLYSNTATGYSGAQCVILSGPGNSPDGTAPTYPARSTCPTSPAGQSSVTFAAGTASPNVTLFDASTTNLTVTDAPSSKAGSTGDFTVGAAPATVMKLAACLVNGGPTACTSPFAVGDGGDFKANIDIFDAFGNVPAPTSVSITITSDNSQFVVSGGQFSVTGSGSPINRSNQLTVTYTSTGNATSNITAHATRFTDLVFEVTK